MNIKLIIDNRESIKSNINVENIKYDNLTLGDYVYTIDEEIFLIIDVH